MSYLPIVNQELWTLSFVCMLVGGGVCLGWWWGGSWGGGSKYVSLRLNWEIFCLMLSLNIRVFLRESTCVMWLWTLFFLDHVIRWAEEPYYDHLVLGVRLAVCLYLMCTYSPETSWSVS